MSKIAPSSIRKGKLLEGVVDEILSEIKTAVNEVERNRFDYQYVRNQDGNGRGNKGRTIDFFLVAEFKISEYKVSIPLLIDTKNYRSYKITSKFKEKFLGKVLDTRKKLKKAGLDKAPFIFVGHFQLTPYQKKKLMKNGVKWFVTVENDLEEDATPEEIEEYKINLRCHLLAVLDVLFPNLLKGLKSNYKVCIYDKYHIGLTKDSKFFRNFDLRNIKQNTIYYIGPKLMDFIAWSESADVVGIAIPWKEYYFDDERVEIKNPIVGEKSERCIEQLGWISKDAMIHVTRS